MKMFIKSSSRMKIDPLYHKRKVDSLQPKRDVLLNLACFIEDTLPGEYDCREVKLLRRDADRLTARIRYHIDGLRISLNVEAEKRKYGA